jgi:hypothetical protein
MTFASYGIWIASKPFMNRHLVGLAVFLIASVALVIVAVFLGRLWLVCTILVMAPIIGGVLATAFMRARGHEAEHHAPVDRHLHDTEP